MGLDVSEYLCERFGWEHGTVDTWSSPTPFDLVICYDVVQYLDDRRAARALANLGRLCHAVLYFGALTATDWRRNCDRRRTDAEVHMRDGSWYRTRLRRSLPRDRRRLLAAPRRAPHGVGARDGRLNVPSQIIRFKGPVNWVAGPGRAGITLLGQIVEADGRLTAAQLSLIGAAALATAAAIDDLSVAALARAGSGAAQRRARMARCTATPGSCIGMSAQRSTRPSRRARRRGPAVLAWRCCSASRQRLRDAGCWRGAAAPISGGVAAEKVKSRRNWQCTGTSAKMDPKEFARRNKTSQKKPGRVTVR